jgi:hypothetical protein
MSLLDDLRVVAQRAHAEQALLEHVEQLLKDQRLWRDAWIDAEKRVDLLTSQISMLKLSCNLRKEKENDD